MTLSGRKKCARFVLDSLKLATLRDILRFWRKIFLRKFSTARAPSAMSVPNEDIVCRFVRSKDWSEAEKRPKPGAFKGPNLSLWHVEELLARNVQIEQLQIGHLEASGQAHYTAGDYHELAEKASGIEGLTFRVRVEWRPDDEFVHEAWRKWSYAHIQVETVEGPEKFPALFRRKLSLFKNRHLVPPSDD